jgi:NCS1 family nucleobase:cation symporter-1
MYRRWSWRGLLAYGLGFASMMPFAVAGNLEGPIARLMNGTDISMITGLIVAAGVYLLVCRSLDVTAEREAVRVADTGLDPDAVPQPWTAVVGCPPWGNSPM